MSNNGGGGAVFKLTPAQKRKLALLSPNARPAYLHALKKQHMKEQALANGDPVPETETCTQVSGSEISGCSSETSERGGKGRKKKKSKDGKKSKKKKGMFNFSSRSSKANEDETEDAAESAVMLTLDQCISSTIVATMFLEYSKTQLCEENVRLYYNLLSLQHDQPHLSEEEFKSRSCQIVDRYLTVGSDQEVNISDAVRTELVDSVTMENTPDPEWFNHLKFEIEALLQHDSFLKFVSSYYAKKNREKIAEALQEPDNSQLLSDFALLTESTPRYNGSEGF